MNFSDKVYELAKHLKEVQPYIDNEETTKSAMIIPFIKLLGYDIQDPRIVRAEYTADTKGKNGEKVDYAIMKNNLPTILIECKPLGSNFDCMKNANQLQRYFNFTSSAKIAILTDGTCYKFYSDLEAINIMDEKPFMTFDFKHIDKTLIPELEKLSNKYFNVENALSSADTLKHITSIKRLLKNEFEQPENSSEKFTKFVLDEIYEGKKTQKIIDRFKPLIKKEIDNYIKDKINSRIEVLKEENLEDETEIHVDNDNEVITTEDEWQGYYIVKAILSNIADLKRIFIRDTKSYCGILLDDNNRKPILRLRFNGKQKAIGFFKDENNYEYIEKIDSLDDIHKYSEEIKSIYQLRTK